MSEAWTRRNQRLLVAELNRLHARLSGQAVATTEPPSDTRLAQVVSGFQLSAFERDLLLWCAGAELDERFTPPTFSAALSLLDGGHWDAMATTAPLRRWRLVELGHGSGLIGRPLRIDERILHHLVGVVCLDARLDGLVRALPDTPATLTPAQQLIAADLATRLGKGKLVVALHGAGEQTRARVAAHAATANDLMPLEIPGDRVPPLGPENAALATLVEREAILLGALPVITVDADTPHRTITAFVAELGCPVVVSGQAAIRADLTCTVPAPSVGEQRDLWEQLLGPVSELDQVTAAFRLQVEEIEAIARDVPADLHDACRRRSRGGIADLAELIEPAAVWEDVVLPEFAVEMLRDITSQMRHRTLVYEGWGMAGSTGRGLGVTALFTGDSGTGKTLAAEVLAGALNLDLYRIDLASVVSKYIGETEKNLRRVFDAADASGAVLLFDEADAIFGKRSEVRDSHDRYANLEVSYLLQRMETYRGLAILTTNLKSALDRSFLRRLRFVVPFPFPDAAARARIWRLMFPPRVPVSNLDWDRLARMQLSGGNIRTIALGAAFLAASAGEPVRIAHVLTAARREYLKLEKPLTEAELGGSHA
jgi:ATPase family associated with various cellular activities (AAA)